MPSTKLLRCRIDTLNILNDVIWFSIQCLEKNVISGISKWNDISFTLSKLRFLIGTRIPSCKTVPHSNVFTKTKS